ncbi:hypothetical protein [Microcoleus sp.]|uniref:hypothetical protein n=1 Tax=Microcoleus sp. TaxID=44472 RepID=UPI003526AC65
MLKIENGKLLPTPIPDLTQLTRKFIERDDTKYQYHEALTSNICYNLQYLESLDFLLSNKNQYFKLTTVLQKQTIKTIVITTTGIIEGILYYLIVTRGEPATTDWKLVMKIQNNKRDLSGKEYMIKNELLVRENDEWESVMGVISGTKKHSNGKHYKIESEVFVKLENAINTEMSLDQMIKKVRNKNLLGEDGEIYDDIDKLRKSRNKVHIRIIEERTDTDWKSFDQKLLELSKKVLSNVLKEVGIFTDDQLSQEAFSYLDN